MLENIGNTITRLPMDQLEWKLGDRIPSCSRHVRRDAEQRRIEHSVVMGVWRLNTWTNFEEIRYTKATSDLNDSRVIKY